MTLEFLTDIEEIPTDTQRTLSEVANACAKAEGISYPVSATLRVVDDERIREVNRETRGVDRATDVLSFPTVRYGKHTARGSEKRVRREYDPDTGTCFLGDILLSLPRARAQAEEYGHSLKREMCYLTAHALFHLMGYDHEKESDKAAMRAMEEKALGACGIFRDEEKAEQALYEKACEVMKNAYAPYSRFQVGAALQCESGEIYTGVNVENASFGATICAERTAACTAIAHGEKRFVKIAIAGSGAVAWPCGICRQMLSEFAAQDMVVLAGHAGAPYRPKTLSELLPNSFGPKDLETPEE